MNVIKIQNEVEKLVAELKRIAQDNNVNINVDTSRYEDFKGTVRIFEVSDEIEGSYELQTIYKAENDKTEFEFIKIIPAEKEKTA